MNKIIYTGEFLGRDYMSGDVTLWRVDIWRRMAPDQITDSRPEELMFEGSEAAVIEWETKAKEEVIGSSTCTLRIESPGDRTYIGLYAIEPGSIGINIYRDDELYWSGTLDPEFYEEPYERSSRYPVTLTFSDLGILGRLKYNSTGIRSIQEILSECIERCRLSENLEIDTSMMSLKRSLEDGERLPVGVLPSQGIGSLSLPVSLDQLFVNSANFYDEDGEPMTLKEVVEGMLQPLALKMEQRCGRLYVYDLNGLYTSGRQQRTMWSNDRQTLGVDCVKNNVKVSWSPYASMDELSDDKCWPEDIETPVGITNMDSLSPKNEAGCDIYSYHLTQDPNTFRSANGSLETVIDDNTDVGFSIWLRDTGNDKVEIVNTPGRPAARIYRIVPVYDGDESEGVMIRMPAVSQARRVLKQGILTFRLNDKVEVKKLGFKEFADLVAFNGTSAMLPDPMPIFKTKPVDIAPADPDKLNVKIAMRMLTSVKYNPFEQAIDWPGDNQWHARWEQNWRNQCNFAYVPIRVCYQSNDDASVYSWRSDIPYSWKGKNNYAVTFPETLSGVWKLRSSFDMDRDLSYLCYYNKNDRQGQSGSLGWNTNRQCIYPTSHRLETALSESDDGQYIPYPPFDIQGVKGGKLWVEVLAPGWQLVKCNTVMNKLTAYDPGATWATNLWILCELPMVEIVSSDTGNREIKNEDVEYSAEINPDAKEGIELDTVCGTKAGGMPTARGAYFSPRGKQLTEFIRAGRKGPAEDLLIGTIYSQYATRHTTLKGEARINVSGVTTWTEDNQSNKVFLLAGEIQDLQTNCGDRTLIELSPDEYTKKC